MRLEKFLIKNNYKNILNCDYSKITLDDMFGFRFKILDILKYRNLNILEIYDIYIKKSICSKNNYSKISQKLFWSIFEILNEEERLHAHFAEYNKEYCLITKEKTYLYDLVISNLNFCIEFNGDHYHGNPDIYKPNDLLKARGVTHKRAKDVWEEDQLKINKLKNLRNYDTIIVWENDYLKTPERIIDKIKEIIIERRNR